MSTIKHILYLSLVNNTMKPIIHFSLVNNIIKHLLYLSLVINITISKKILIRFGGNVFIRNWKKLSKSSIKTYLKRFLPTYSSHAVQVSSILIFFVFDRTIIQMYIKAYSHNASLDTAAMLRLCYDNS